MFFNRILEPLLSVVREAGTTILSIYDSYRVGTLQNLGLISKVDQSPLTAADIAAHQIIKIGLQSLAPNVFIVSEEDAPAHDHIEDHKTFWLVDPLDGTKEFLAKNDEFTVNVALVECGQPTLGVVYAPALDQLYWGGKEIGAFRESAGKKVLVRSTKPLSNNKLRVVASKSHLNKETEAFIKQLGDVSLIQAGSSLKMCRVAEGAADVYPRLAATYGWDTAAAHAVVEGAGGSVVDMRGNRLIYSSQNLLNPHFIVSGTPLQNFV